jgi:hypothetical protein
MAGIKALSIIGQGVRDFLPAAGFFKEESDTPPSGAGQFAGKTSKRSSL